MGAITGLRDFEETPTTNVCDEAITTPTDESVRRAMAIQLIISREWGVAKNEDPNQGAFVTDELTDLVEEAVRNKYEAIAIAAAFRPRGTRLLPQGRTSRGEKRRSIMQDKETVLRQVQAAIGRQAHMDMQTRPLAMDFDAGRLTLAGEVADIAIKKIALRAAAEVEGVEDVIDRLCIDAGPSPGDGAIRDAVCRGLLTHIDFQNCALHARIKGQRETLRVAGGSDPSGDIEVGVRDGIVTLDGQVISLTHMRMAGVLAWWVRGCRDVVNRLAVVPAEEDSDDEIADALRLVLEVDPYVAAAGIGIDSRDHTVTLGGTVASAGERERAERDAWCVFAVDRVVNRIRVR